MTLTPTLTMAGLDPAIHVDGRLKAAHGGN